MKNLNTLNNELIQAIKRNNIDKCRLCIQNGANVNHIIKKYRYNNTPLHIACNNFDANINLVKFLLDNGADVNATDRTNTTALLRVYSKGNIEIVKLLINSGADINIINNDGINILLYSIRNNDIEMMKLLLKNGANINISRLDKNNNINPVFEDICHVGNTDMLNIILPMDIDINATNNTNTILHGNLSGEVVQILINNGADVNVRNLAGESPLCVAAMFGNIEMMTVLINNGANKVICRHAVDFVVDYKSLLDQFAIIFEFIQDFTIY